MPKQHVKWDAVMAILRGSYRTLLYGPPGTGKTRAAFETAKTLGKSIYNVTLTDETPAAELRGHYVPEGTEWTFRFGPATLAATKKGKGAVLCLDEIDKASQDCLDFLHGLLNDREMAQLTLPTGQIITPANGFQVIATMNGDLRDLQPSLQDRFAIAMEITEPHPDAVRSLPQDLQGVAKNVESYDAQERPATIRRWKAFATLREIEGISVQDAALAVFAHRAPELMDAIQFKSTLTEEEGILLRARAWAEHNAITLENSEGDPFCPLCATVYPIEGGEERQAREEALLCCYDDEMWLEYCNTSGYLPS